MTRLPIALALFALFAAGPAAAAPQQEKMKTCNADAKTKALAGDARKAFMKECLSAAAPAAAATAAAPTKTPQQEKMKTCNAAAKTQALAGDARKKFMKECLSAK